MSRQDSLASACNKGQSLHSPRHRWAAHLLMRSACQAAPFPQSCATQVVLREPMCPCPARLWAPCHFCCCTAFNCVFIKQAAESIRTLRGSVNPCSVDGFEVCNAPGQLPAICTCSAADNAAAAVVAAPAQAISPSSDWAQDDECAAGNASDSDSFADVSGEPDDTEVHHAACFQAASSFGALGFLHGRTGARSHLRL